MLQQAPNVKIPSANLPYSPRKTRRLPSPPVPKSRLLLVCDEPPLRAQYAAALSAPNVEIISPNQIETCVGHDYALAIVNVPAAQLVETLAALRAGDECTSWPILVEASEALSETRFAGVLPRYRAMACSRADLLALARLRLAPQVRTTAAGKML